MRARMGLGSRCPRSSLEDLPCGPPLLISEELMNAPCRLDALRGRVHDLGATVSAIAPDQDSGIVTHEGAAVHAQPQRASQLVMRLLTQGTQHRVAVDDMRAVRDLAERALAVRARRTELTP